MVLQARNEHWNILYLNHKNRKARLWNQKKKKTIIPYSDISLNISGGSTKIWFYSNTEKKQGEKEWAVHLERRSQANRLHTSKHTSTDNTVFQTYLLTKM